MTITFANESHIPGMIALLKQVGQVHHDIRPDLFRDGAQKYDKNDLELLIKDPSRPILIAEAEGQVAGYCFCILKQTQGNPVLMDDRTLYIDDLCVDASCRGRGIATALYEWACDLARELDCRSITLNVWCGNNGAMQFYEKMGMKPRNIHMEYTLC